MAAGTWRLVLNVTQGSDFDGGHDDYHQPTDTVDKINFAKMEKVARLSYLTLRDVANAPSRPAKASSGRLRLNES